MNTLNPAAPKMNAAMNITLRSLTLGLLIGVLCSSTALAGLLRLRMLDVGSDAYMINLPTGKIMVVDASTTANGPAIVQRLQQLGVTRIDFLLITHQDGDHIGGAPALIDMFDIGKIFFPIKHETLGTGYNNMKAAADAKGIPITKVGSGNRQFPNVVVDGYTLEALVISPRSGFTSTSSVSPDNAYSIVFGRILSGKPLRRPAGHARSQREDPS